VAKSAAPKSSVGFCSCVKSAPAFSSLGLAGACLVDLYLLTSLKALIVPGFRLQVFLLQLKICSLRSSSGKWDGRSPFNWRSRDMKPLQALHFARLPGGENRGSSHAYARYDQHRSRVGGGYSTRTGMPPRWLTASSVASFEAYPRSTPVSV
jgi:hypothetical protein